MNGEVRKRVLLPLDAESVEAEPDKARVLDRALVDVPREVCGTLLDKRVIKRAYGADGAISLLNKLQGGSGWRLGGTGHEEDIVPYMLSDCTSFCMECPGETVFVLCSNRPEFLEMVGVLDGAGVEVKVVRPQLE